MHRYKHTCTKNSVSCLCYLCSFCSVRGINVHVVCGCCVFVLFVVLFLEGFNNEQNIMVHKCTPHHQIEPRDNYPLQGAFWSLDFKSRMAEGKSLEKRADHLFHTFANTGITLSRAGMNKMCRHRPLEKAKAKVKKMPP